MTRDDSASVAHHGARSRSLGASTEALGCWPRPCAAQWQTVAAPGPASLDEALILVVAGRGRARSGGWLAASAPSRPCSRTCPGRLGARWRTAGRAAWAPACATAGARPSSSAPPWPAPWRPALPWVTGAALAVQAPTGPGFSRTVTVDAPVRAPPPPPPATVSPVGPRLPRPAGPRRDRSSVRSPRPDLVTGRSAGAAARRRGRRPPRRHAVGHRPPPPRPGRHRRRGRRAPGRPGTTRTAPSSGTTPT